MLESDCVLGNQSVKGKTFRGRIVGKRSRLLRLCAGLTLTIVQAKFSALFGRARWNLLVSAPRKSVTEPWTNWIQLGWSLGAKATP